MTQQPRWPASLAVVLVLALQLLLPDEVGFGPSWVVPLLQAALLVPLIGRRLMQLESGHPLVRTLALVVAAVVVGANLARLLHLVVLIGGGTKFAAGDLVLAAVIILVTNLVGTAVVFWELDRGGPAGDGEAFLLFPQMTLDDPQYRDWQPNFVDYLFVAFTASTAFSPTDTMPLSRSFKVLFALSATTALTTIAVVAARAVSLV